MPPRNAPYWLMAGFALSAAVFTLWPGIDLWVSGLFFHSEHGFVWAESWAVGVVREAIRLMMYFVPLVALVLWASSIFGLRVAKIPGRLWAFLFALFMVGPGVIVNSVLKAHWGRARPAHITEFGGEAAFTPALRVADECARNCSFVSGEGAGATALAISIVVLVPYILGNRPKPARRRALGWLLLIPATGIFLRVAMGRHFLSDTVFAILIVLGIALALWRLLGLGKLQRP